MFNRMPIRTMLLLGFGVVIFFLALIVAVTHVRVSGIAAGVGEIDQDIYPNTTAAAQIRYGVMMNWSNTLMLTNITNKEVIKRISDEMAANSKQISENFEFLKRVFVTEEGKKLVAAAQAAREDYTSKRKEYLAMLADADKDPANFFLIGPLRASLDAYMGSINDILAALNDRFAHGTADAVGAATQTRSLNLIIGVLALGIAVASAILIIRTVAGQLGGEIYEAGDLAREIADGNLAASYPVRAGDTHSLLAALSEMRMRLRAMVEGIQHSAAQVRQNAAEVSDAAGEVARSSSSQTEAAQSAAAAVEELTVSINQLSTNAEDAFRFTESASELSRNGESVISRAGSEMEKIAQSVRQSSDIIAALEKQSGEISAVVNVIREIADQTNLLALNAAIEAARAGEQGRGFAVVADEVRKLAERTASSTQVISTTIEHIQSGTQSAVRSMEEGVGQVRSGTAMAQQAERSIAEIQSSSEHVVEAVNDITLALKEQGAASNHIAQSIEQISQMVNANDAASKRVVASAGEMEKVASGLVASASHFRL